MQLNNTPAKIQEAFAVNGQRNAIPVPSQVSTTPGAASFNDGFPPATMQPIASGGVPPSGKDMNGVLYAITAVQQWQCAGGQFQFDSAFASANGGYPKGAILLSADGTGLWMNTSDGNSTNPDATDGSALNWVALSASGYTSITGLTNANVTLTTAQWGKQPIFASGTLTGNVQLIFPNIAGMRWTVMNNTSGAFTLTVKTASGTGIAIPQGQIQGVMCDGTNIRAIGWANGEAIDGSPIGQTTPAAGSFTTLTNTGVATLSSGMFTGSQAPTTGVGVRIIYAGGQGDVFAYDYTAGASKTLLLNGPGGDTQAPNGINNTPIGQTTPAAITGTTGKFTSGIKIPASVNSSYKTGGGWVWDTVGDGTGTIQGWAYGDSTGLHLGANATVGSNVLTVDSSGALAFQNGYIQNPANEFRFFAKTGMTLTLGSNGVAGALTVNTDGTVAAPNGINGTPIGQSTPAAITGTTIHASGGHINLDNGYYLNTKDNAGVLGSLLGMDASNIVRLYGHGSNLAATIDTSGNATFNDPLNVPAATASGHAAQLGQTLGYTGQSYQDVTASRALNTVYTNTASRPILVFVGFNGALQEDTYTVSINGGTAIPFTAGNGYGGGVFIVPPGQTYKVAAGLGSPGNPQYWNELR